MKTGTLLPQNLTASQITEIDANKKIVSAGSLSGVLKVAAGVLAVAGVADIPFSMKSGTTTHDSAVTGTQTISGVGFTPTIVILAMFPPVLNGTGSLGIDDATHHLCIFSPTTTGAANALLSSSAGIVYVASASNYAYASISSMNSDGFVLTWGKGLSPTGTVTILYLAIKA